MNDKSSIDNMKLLFFSILISVVAYGFALTNFTLSIDNEQIFHSNSGISMDLGRWGTNLIRCQIFQGIIPYFTLLFSLLIMSLTSVELSKLFKLNGIKSYIFCGLFLTFPQLSYQFIFTMQADAIAIGFLCSVLAVKLFIENIKYMFSIKSIMYLMFSAFLLMFVIAIYQALVFIPVIIYLIHLFLNSFENENQYDYRKEFKNIACFGVLMIISVLFYYVSTKILCPNMGSGYLSTYTSGNSNDRFIDFYNLWIDNLRGDMYYGNKTFLIASIVALLLIVKFAYEKKLFVIRILILVLLLLIPFFISFFITNGANPPRLYVASGIVFAFIVTHFISYFKYEKITLIICSVICLVNIYFITLLFQSSNKIYNHDLKIAEKINNEIYTKYPEFDATINYVYFFGGLPYGEHEKFRLPNSEIFGGSFFLWDGGSNNRIINFFKFSDIAYYKEIDNKNTYLSIKDSIKNIPTWPKKGYIKMVNNVVIVKLGEKKGAVLSIE